MNELSPAPRLLPLPSAGQRPPARPDADLEAASPRLKAAARDFEALFVSQMMAPVFEAVGEDPLFGGGPGEAAYRGLLVEEYGKAVAASGRLGITEGVLRQMLQAQEARP